MLTFTGKRDFLCDGVSRRNFLRVGALGIGGLTLSDLLRAEALAGPNIRKKSIINIYLGGGPTHLDTFDLKPDAPKEIRGEFRGISTAIPGYQVCELMPQIARVMDKMVVIRSVADFRNEHRPNQSESGWNSRELESLGGHPSVGSVVSKVHGPINGSAPTFIDFGGHSNPGFLGSVHSAYRPDGQGRSNLILNRSVSTERLQDRRVLLSELDRLRRDADTQGQMQAMDAFTERAINVITSGEVSDALDLDKEDPRVVERYKLNQGRRGRDNRNFILARRLVEVGVRCVSMRWGGWDTHGNNFKTMREQLPSFDTGLSTLIEDLDSRGMLEDTLICVSGEFGRTPRINSRAGRDHWPRSGFFVMAGGGLRTGQVIGTTNRLGEEPQDRPVSLHEIFATIYHTLGIDANRVTLTDPNGRPQYLTKIRRPMPELV